jgi:hypothetical protein
VLTEAVVLPASDNAITISLFRRIPTGGSPTYTKTRSLGRTHGKRTKEEEEEEEEEKKKKKKKKKKTTFVLH